MNYSNALEMLPEVKRYIYDVKNLATKDEVAFDKTVEVFKEAKSILFNSMITNEEAQILQELKDKHGYKLINKGAKKFQAFLKSYGSISEKHLYGATLDMVKDSEVIIVLGCSVSTDNPILLTTLKNTRDAYISYMHPLEDKSLNSIISQHIKYEVGSEEGLVAMLAELVLTDEGKEISKSFFDDLDIGYICGESSVGEEEFDSLHEKIENCEKCVLVVGSDVYNHPNSKNIAKILGAISKYSNLEILMITPELNTLGVSLICELDEEVQGHTIGYNIEADYTLSFLEGANLDMPSFIQQEGTITTLDKKVIRLENAFDFNGYRLNDIANALEVQANDTTEYTAKLPVISGYKAVVFNDLKKINEYELVNVDVKNEGEILDNINEISEFNGSVIYRCNHPLSYLDSKGQDNLVLVGSKQFATAAKVKTGTMVRFEMDGKTYQRCFEVCEDLKGTIAYNPVFDSIDNYDEYRYKRVNLEEVNE